ncbi:hypothetical protein QEH56_17670 [Pelagicoccus enzymogenes]|uniref:hypothetical protein n=1 Tax=Pelagicoccus enzymogenes TaxID=2773457 RepID=UPI0028101BE2|nr:hypothetical protein [Pelagicoccus enzymogenes]MDQ8199997.1 hypothetical protein [Pelagicoccus enzymogenes]
MNKTKRILICATGLVLGALSSSTAYGQEAEAGVEANVDVQTSLNLESSLLNSNLNLNASEKLIARASVNRDRLSEEMQANLTALEEAQAEIVATWESEYKPAVDATQEQILEARAAFEAEMETQIDAALELRKSLVAGLREDLRAQVGSRDWSGEARAKFQAYGEIKAQIGSSWVEAKAELGEDATRSEIAAAKEAFLEANAELIAQQKALAAELRALVRSEMAEERPQIDREALPEAIAELRADIQLARGTMSERKDEVREEMSNLSGEAQAELRQEIALELQASFDEIKEKRRQLIDDLKDEQDGDRRQED